MARRSRTIVWFAVFIIQVKWFTVQGLSFHSSLPRHKHGSRFQQTNNSDSTAQHNLQQPQASKGIRLNKVFKATHSRREADALIASGRVSINNVPVTTKGGCLVTPFVDIVKLDDKVVVGWETLNGLTSLQDYSTEETGGAHEKSPNKNNQISMDAFEYVKYWKPRGVTCTTDQRVPYNIIDEIYRDGYNPKHRVYPVGRLDKDTSGLILLTSDGRLPNASLRKKQKQPKVYEVFVDKPFRDVDLEKLRHGLVITTIAQRDSGKAKPLTAKTKPCLVHQIDEYGVEMTLYEGRNRQVRKMMQALDLRVVDLHRVSFSGISLEPLQGPGSWKRLNQKELNTIRRIMQEACDDANSAETAPL